MDCDDMIDTEYEDFIRVYDKVVSRSFCRGIIDYFEWCKQNQKTWRRDESSLIKRDESVKINPSCFDEISFAEEHLSGYMDEFNEVFWKECYPSYVNEFDVIRDMGNHSVFTYKIQKTMPSEGYHIWHCESDSRLRSTRIFAYILFLNDVGSGGETEFLYQRKRINPVEGRLVIFPAAYTHAHRGNPPLRGSKYILTGWLEFN